MWTFHNSPSHPANTSTYCCSVYQDGWTQCLGVSCPYTFQHVYLLQANFLSQPIVTRNLNHPFWKKRKGNKTINRERVQYKGVVCGAAYDLHVCFSSNTRRCDLNKSVGESSDSFCSFGPSKKWEAYDNFLCVGKISTYRLNSKFELDSSKLSR